MENKQPNDVIFFDGFCGLCNGFVDFILSIDKRKKFLFSPLQSDFAKAHLPPELITDLKSVVYLHDGVISTKSKAVLEILNGIGGIWNIATLGKILPAKVLNLGYDMVAENRYKIFGKKETCRLPTPEERTRFVI